MSEARGDKSQVIGVEDARRAAARAPCGIAVVELGTRTSSLAHTSAKAGLGALHLRGRSSGFAGYLRCSPGRQPVRATQSVRRILAAAKWFIQARGSSPWAEVA